MQTDGDEDTLTFSIAVVTGIDDTDDFNIHNDAY